MQHKAKAAGRDGHERRRLEAVVETLAAVHGAGQSLAEVAHDARNMVTALGLYCDLLEEPGVLATPYRHYGSELRLVAAASRRIVEKLVTLDTQGAPPASDFDLFYNKDIEFPIKPVRDRLRRSTQSWESLSPMPINNLAAEIVANRNLLAALAGPTILVTVDIEAGEKPVRLSGEDLTRVLVNLIKNAAEAMPGGGEIQIRLSESCSPREGTESVKINIDDNGPGIPANALEKIFEAGFSTRPPGSSERGWPATHRGLGLCITRSIVEAAGGLVHAESGVPSGARFVLELPVRTN